MLKENNKVLKCSNASPDWRGYVDFVNNVVVDGLSRVICASLDYLLDQVLFDPDTSWNVCANLPLSPLLFCNELTGH